MMKQLKLLFLICTLMFIEVDSSFSQSVIIGSGTTVNGPTESSPVNIWYRKVVSHFVYTAAEINAAGFTGSGIINKIGWYITQSPQYNIPGYRIQMKLTNATNAAGIANGGWTNARSASTYAPTAGDWDLLTLDSPFTWDGSQNLAVRICWTQVQPTYSSSGQCRVTNTNNGYEYRWSDNNGNGCGQNPNTLNNIRPQVHFMFDTITVWNGSVSTDWFNASNWSAGVPTERMDARIPVAVPNNPNLTGSGLCEEFILEGTLTNSAGGVLNVYDNFTNTGSWIDAGGRLVMTGSAASTLSTTAMTITDLFIENSGGTVISGAMITIINELQVTTSTLNTGNLVTMKSDLAGTARIAELKSSCAYTLNMQDSWGDGWNGGFVTVLEDGISIGNFSANGNGSTEVFNVSSGAIITLNYTSGSWENENTYDLVDPFGTIIFSDGINPATGNVFTTTASCNFTAPISGTISMERYVDAGETNWRYFGSAVQGATLGQYNDDFITAGYPGSAFPAFGWVSIYTYDESLGPTFGYLPATSSAQVIQVGEGVQVWCGDTITGTQPFTVDLQGVPNQGDIAFNVSYTNTGTPTEDGWNHISNPYPSAIDWDDLSWTKINMANATYIFNPDNEQYATYVAGAGTNGGVQYIASQQSFWVYATAASPQLVATERTKSNVDPAFFKTPSTLNPGVTIRLNGIQEFDETVIRHLDGSIDDFEYAYDAKKWWGGWGQYPQLSLINGQDEDLTVHSFDKANQEWSIPLRAIVFADGVYTIQFENINALDVPCLQLEDTYTGMMYEIYEGVILSFEMSDTTYAPRFMLHLGKNYETSSIEPSCYASADGSIELDLNDSQDFDYNLTSVNGTTSGTGAGNPLTFDNLETGVYSIEVLGLANLCSQTVFNVVLEQPSPIITIATVSDETLGNDGAIEVDISGGTAPYTYLWSTGEIDFAIDNLSPGLYSLLVVDANACENIDEYLIGSVLGIDGVESDIEFFYSPLTGEIIITGWDAENNESLSLYDMQGSLIATYQLAAQQGTQYLKVPEYISTGVYLLQGSQAGLRFKFLKNQ